MFVCPLLTYDCKRTIPLTSQLIQQNRQNRIILYGFMISICTIRPVFKVTTMHTLRLVSIITQSPKIAARSLIYLCSTKYASYAPYLPPRCDRGTSEVPPLTSHVLLYKVRHCLSLVIIRHCNDFHHAICRWLVNFDSCFDTPLCVHVKEGRNKGYFRLTRSWLTQ